MNGKTIAFTLQGISAGSAITNASGIATLAGVSLTGINTGTHPAGAGSGVAASFVGDSGFVASSGAATLTVSKATQAIVTISAPPSATYQQAGLSVTSGGGSGTGAFSYDAGTSTGCTVNASTGALSITSGSGTCAVTATRAADTNYNVASSAAASVTIGRAVVTAAAGGGSAIYDGTPKSPAACVVSGAFTLGVSCANSPASVGPNAGTTSILPIVSGADSANFVVTLTNGSYSIAPAPSTTVVTCPASVTYNGAAQTPCTVAVAGTAG